MYHSTPTTYGQECHCSAPVSPTFQFKFATFDAVFRPLKKINLAHLNPDMLVGRYVPNLVAKSFEVSEEYAELIYDQTPSPGFDKVLRKWDQDNWDSPEHR